LVDLRLFNLVFALGAGLVTAPGNAATNADYLAERVQHAVVTPAGDRPLAAQMPGLANRVIEIEGVVKGIAAKESAEEGNYAEYQLKLGPGQMARVATETETPAVGLGDRLRVLARAPKSGVVLEEVASARVDDASMPASAAQTDGSMLNREFTNAIPPRDILKQAKQAAPEAEAATAKALIVKRAKGRVAAWKTARAKKKAAAASGQARIYASKIQQVNGDIDAGTAAKIAVVVLKKSRKHGVDPRLVFALLAQESRFNPRAVSPVGAQGLGQLMPATARGLGVRDSFDIEQNVEGSVRYLAEQMQAFGGDFRRALAAYNAGPGNVQRYGGIPPFRETQHYVKTITTHYRQLKSLL